MNGEFEITGQAWLASPSREDTSFNPLCLRIDSIARLGEKVCLAIHRLKGLALSHAEMRKSYTLNLQLNIIVERPWIE